MLKHCEICGTEFECRPSDRIATCSRKECRAEKRARSRRGTGYLRHCAACGKPFRCNPSDNIKTCGKQECRHVIRSKIASVNHPKNVKTCVICGRDFADSPSNKRTTCRREQCTTAARIDSAGKRPEHLQNMRNGIAASPILQPDERHCNAKEYALRAPDGTIYRGRNLALFLRQHHELFEDDDIAAKAAFGCRAAGQLSALNPDRPKPLRSWKGWTWAE